MNYHQTYQIHTLFLLLAVHLDMSDLKKTQETRLFSHDKTGIEDAIYLVVESFRTDALMYFRYLYSMVPGPMQNY